jgi:hypothetical protein
MFQRRSPEAFVRFQLICFIFMCWVTLLGILTHAGAGIAIPAIFAVAFLISWLVRRDNLKRRPPAPPDPGASLLFRPLPAEQRVQDHHESEESENDTMGNHRPTV